MTFRARLVVAATTAVVFAVVLGSVAAYVVSYNSLVGSIDLSLSQTASELVGGQGHNVPTINAPSCSSPGVCGQVVQSDGQSVDGSTLPLPVTDEVRDVADNQGRGPVQFFTTSIGGVDVREVVYPLPPGYTYLSTDGVESTINTLPDGGAFQLTAPLTAVNQELRHLAIDLWIIAAAGVAMAVLLGLAVGRTALVPLNSLTESIEGLAESTDMSQRLDEGTDDELGRLRRAFNRLLAALDSSRLAQQQLVLDASHELRTPLTSLRTNMEVARRLDELEPEERDVLIGDVLTQLEELTLLVGDLAELARGGQPQVTTEVFRLDAVVDEAVSVATTHGRSRSVTFEAAVTETWVAASRARVERAVGNLLDNALKWSPDGGVVEVSCHVGEITVRDHGPGISASDLDHIFDRFYRAPAARGRPGSGLGLAIVAQVAKDERGSVSAEHSVGGGALFRFILPTVSPHPTERPSD